jgi:DNA-binding HxlR family transcriptional regulator
MIEQTVQFDSRRDIHEATGIVGVCPTTVCPTFEVIQGISGKWTAFLMMALAERPHRFGELRRLFPGISQRMLTQTLYDLQRDGYATRVVLPTKPPSVEYSLSPLGQSLFHQLRTVLDWARVNHEAVLEARFKFDSEKLLTRKISLQ